MSIQVYHLKIHRYIVTLPEVSLERREKEKQNYLMTFSRINKFEINFTDFEEGEVSQII